LSGLGSSAEDASWLGRRQTAGEQRDEDHLVGAAKQRQQYDEAERFWRS